MKNLRPDFVFRFDTWVKDSNLVRRSVLDNSNARRQRDKKLGY